MFSFERAAFFPKPVAPVGKPWYDAPMAKNAVALVHIAPAAVKAALDPAPDSQRPELDRPSLDAVEGADGKVYVIESFDDATAVHLGVPLGYDEPDVMGTLVAVALGDLIDEHDDPRGVPMYPSSYTPKATTWEGLLDEIGEALDWAPIEGPELMDPMAGVPDMSNLAAMAAQMQAQLPPEMLQHAMDMAQQLAQAGAMGDIQRAMQQMMQGESPSPMGLDLAEMARQAQRMLDQNPELQQKLAGQFGITDAQLDDDEPGDSKK